MNGRGRPSKQKEKTTQKGSQITHDKDKLKSPSKTKEDSSWTMPMELTDTCSL